MPYYNLTNLSKVGDMGDLLKYANEATNVGNGGQLFGIMLIALFFIMVMVLKRWEFDKALLTSSFACLILGIILSYGKLLPFYFPIIFLTITALTAFYMFMAGAQNN